MARSLCFGSARQWRGALPPGGLAFKPTADWIPAATPCFPIAVGFPGGAAVTQTDPIQITITTKVINDRIGVMGP